MGLRNLVVYEKDVRNIPAFLRNVTFSPAIALSLKALTSRISDETATILNPIHKHLLDAAAHHTHELDVVRGDIEPYHDLYWGGKQDSVGYDKGTILTLSVGLPEADNEVAFSRRPNLDQITPTQGKEPVHYGSQLSISCPGLSQDVDLIADVFARYEAVSANLARISIEDVYLTEDDRRWRTPLVAGWVVGLHIIINSVGG